MPTPRISSPTLSFFALATTTLLAGLLLFLFPAATCAAAPDYDFETTAAATTYNVSLCQSCALVDNKYQVCDTGKGGPVTFPTGTCMQGNGTYIGAHYSSYAVNVNSQKPSEYGFLFFNTTSCAPDAVVGLITCRLHSCCVMFIGLGQATYGGFQVAPLPVPSPSSGGSPGGGGGDGGVNFPSWAAIVLAIGGAVLLVVIIGVGVFLYRKRRTQYQSL
jgi:hypothetical protein